MGWRYSCRKDDSRGGIRQCANSGVFPEVFLYGCWFLISDLWEMGVMSSRVCEMQETTFDELFLP